jgi:hypothetical protein
MRATWTTRHADAAGAAKITGTHAAHSTCAHSAAGTHSAAATRTHAASASATTSVSSVDRKREHEYCRGRNRADVHDCPHRSLLVSGPDQGVRQEPTASLPSVLTATHRSACALQPR